MSRKVAVWRKDPIRPSKYDGKPPYQQVIFKDIENGRTLKMYLDKASQNDTNFSRWQPHLQEGTVLMVDLNGYGNVNPFCQFRTVTK